MSDEKDKDLEMVKEHIKQLIEHFETVQIFVTKPSEDKEGGTIAVQNGAGNWYARDGQCREWVLKNEEEYRDSVRNRNNEDD